MDRISQLLDLHTDLDRMFFEHQSSLLHFEFVQALELLNRYEECLITHMRDEESVLLPVYAGQSNISRSATVEMFLDEHDKMRAHIEFFKRQISEIAAIPHKEPGLIALLDSEAFYKRLCSHHDKREHDHLYPVLDAVTSDTEKLDLLSRITCNFDLAASAAS